MYDKHHYSDQIQIDNNNNYTQELQQFLPCIIIIVF